MLANSGRVLRSDGWAAKGILDEWGVVELLMIDEHSDREVFVVVTRETHHGRQSVHAGGAGSRRRASPSPIKRGRETRGRVDASPARSPTERGLTAERAEGHRVFC